ncbi:MAG: ExbD/TolR family protein [Bdellovibrionia bacterium]
MKLRSPTLKRARIEIIPMIDVIFFLLVFFMISSLASSSMNAIGVSLPQSSKKASPLDQDVMVSIQKEGALFVNQKATELQALGALLVHEMRENPEQSVVIRADQGTNYGFVIQVMDEARKVGVRKFALATELSQEPSR